MERTLVSLIVAFVFLQAAVSQVSVGAPVGKSFTYQGQLKSDGVPVTGTVNAVFSLWNHPTDTSLGAKVGGDQVIAALPVSNGFFSVVLNAANEFGALALDGNERWLQITIDSSPLSARQPILAAPYAVQTRGLFVDDSGGLGLGTSSPSAKLTINVGGGDNSAVLAIREDDVEETFSLRADLLAPAGSSKLRLINAFGGALMTWSAGGAIGVGTASPVTRVHVEGGTDAALGGGGYLTLGPTAGGNLAIDDNEIMARSAGVTSTLHLNHNGGDVLISALSADGDVGIGVSTPASRLDVAGSLRLRETGSPAIILSGNGESAADTGIGHPSDGVITLVSNNAERVRVTSGGHVGIGTTAPGAPLHVVDTAGFPQAILENAGGSGTWLSLRNTSAGGRSWNLISTGNTNGEGAGKLLFNDQSGGGTRMTIDGAGQVGIATASPATTLDVNGTTTTKALHITGGADVAEPFEIAAADDIVPQPGMVVSIDPERIGGLRIARRAQDRSVAGVISGANGIQPGLTLSQTESVADGQWPVAAVGRVWCWVDADAGGPVAAGDLLTTSATPGHAMKVRDAPAANGAILGKAMSPLEAGRGLVLVLVALQ